MQERSWTTGTCCFALVLAGCAAPDATVEEPKATPAQVQTASGLVYEVVLLQVTDPGK